MSQFYPEQILIDPFHQKQSLLLFRILYISLQILLYRSFIFYQNNWIQLLSIHKKLKNLKHLLPMEYCPISLFAILELFIIQLNSIYQLCIRLQNILHKSEEFIIRFQMDILKVYMKGISYLGHVVSININCQLF